MKKFLEIFALFVVCVASFLAGWVMSLRYQQKLSGSHLTQPLSRPNNQFLSEPDHLKKILSGPDPAETSLKNLPMSVEFSPIPLDNSPNEVSVPADTSKEASSSGQPVKEPTKTLSEKKKVSEAPFLSESQRKKKEEVDKLNRDAFKRIKGRQNVFNEKGQFSFLINVFSQEKEALEYISNLRAQFPLWGFFLKPDRQNFRIYLGPFLTKDQAGDFIKVLPDPKPFPNYFLETEGL